MAKLFVMWKHTGDFTIRVEVHVIIGSSTSDAHSNALIPDL